MQNKQSLDNLQDKLENARLTYSLHEQVTWLIAFIKWYLHILNTDSLVVGQNSTDGYCTKFNASILST